MTYLIRTTADARGGVEQRSLYAWLSNDRELRRSARIDVGGADPAPDAMGPDLDVIQLIVDSTFQTASLAVALAAWRRACRPRTAVTIERDGVTVTIPEGSAVEAEDILCMLGELGEEDPA